MSAGMTESRKWFMLAGVLAAGWLLYLLAPVLTPFLIGALLAYLGDPLVDRLESLRLSRTLAVLTVFVTMTFLGLMVLLILLPMLEQQIGALLAKTPMAIEWFQQQVLPRLSAVTGATAGEGIFNMEALKKALAGHWQEMGTTLGGLMSGITASGQTLLVWLFYLVLIPVVTFYLLRDWDTLISHAHDLLPRRYADTVTALIKECDQVLAEFLRGQFTVMLSLGAIYTAGLWLIGLDYAFSIGLLAGLVSFVPYLGLLVGVSLASFASLVQFQDWPHFFFVIGVFGIGQLLEGMVLSPRLVGERIGLHPVAVIFAVMAGGQLFGFFGVLLALPAAAVVVVLLRHSRELYFQSDLYTP
jgi:predicted PurR-regulated permease PerM